MITGKCLCECVAYEIHGKLGPIFNCHCSKCRRWHGAAFRTRATIKHSQINWLSGTENIAKFNSSTNVTKHFCKTCGSPLHSTYRDNPDIIGVPLGALEGISDQTPEGHIFTADKASWFSIADHLPQYSQWPGSESTVRQTEQPPGESS